MIIVFHAMRGGVGKSTLLTALSATLKGKILVIDMGVNNPSLVNYFGVKTLKHSINQVLHNDIKLENAIQTIKYEKKRIDFVGASSDPQDIARSVLHTQNHILHNAVKKLAKKYDHILIDTHAGITQKLLLMKDASDMLITVIDNRKNNGLEITKDLAQRLECPMKLIVNKSSKKLKDKEYVLSIPNIKEPDFATLQPYMKKLITKL